MSTPTRSQRRLGAASGVLFVILVLSYTAFGSDDLPKYKAPAQEFAAFAAESSDTLAVGLLLALFAGFALAWFSGMLRSGLQEAGTTSGGGSGLPDVAFAGGLLAATGLVLSSAIRTAAVHEPEDAGGAVIRGMIHAAEAAGALIPLGFALLVIPASLLMLGTPRFNSWLAGLGFVAGIVSVSLFFYSLFLGTGPFFIEVLWPIAVLATLIWITWLSVLMFRRAGTPAG